MGFDDGQIILNSENNTYYAGQTVHGKLEFDQDDVKTFRGLYLVMKGYCKVHWTTSHTRRVNGQTRTYHKTHESYEEYFNKKVFLVGSDSGQHHLQPGHHEFPFHLQIPANCPSSFDGAYGRVKYSIKAVVDRAFKIDQTMKEELRVIAPFDLNTEPYCKEPMHLELMQSYCCWCMNAGSSEVLVKMPVSGYCPGQIMPIEVSCSNTSSVDIKKLKFAIKRDITFHAEHEPGTRNDHDTIAELKKGPVPANTTRNWTVEMEVPAMDVHNLRGCRYIDVDYEFKVPMMVPYQCCQLEPVFPIPQVSQATLMQAPVLQHHPRPMTKTNPDQTHQRVPRTTRRTIPHLLTTKTEKWRRSECLTGDNCDTKCGSLRHIKKLFTS